MSIDEFCGRLEPLRLDRSGGLVKPYKPLLVAAVVFLGILLGHRGREQLERGIRRAPRASERATSRSNCLEAVPHEIRVDTRSLPRCSDVADLGAERT